jgi:hypothetical protein
MYILVVFKTVRKGGGNTQTMKLKYSYITTAPKTIRNWERGFESHKSHKFGHSLLGL